MKPENKNNINEPSPKIIPLSEAKRSKRTAGSRIAIRVAQLGCEKE
jgi:hypothetical protein